MGNKIIADTPEDVENIATHISLIRKTLDRIEDGTYIYEASHHEVFGLSDGSDVNEVLLLRVTRPDWGEYDD